MGSNKVEVVIFRFRLSF